MPALLLAWLLEVTWRLLFLMLLLRRWFGHLAIYWARYQRLQICLQWGPYWLVHAVRLLCMLCGALGIIQHIKWPCVYRDACFTYG